MVKNVGVIGVQMDLGAVRKGVDMGPSAIRHADLLMKLKDAGIEVTDVGDIVPLVDHGEGNPCLRYAREINDANRRLYEAVNRFYKEDRFPLILGGDHSIAAGSVSASANCNLNIGIIWIDAHADFNDEHITPSGNMHGMPLSAVCGCGPDSMVDFCNRRVSPQNTVIVGTRSIDPLEKIKLKQEHVTVFSISDVHTLGMRIIMEKAISIATHGTKGIHLSFDMDALDPADAPGVGTPVLNGLSQREAFIACEMLYQSKQLLAMDLVETNPLLDHRNMTGILASELIMACLGNTDYS